MEKFFKLKENNTKVSTEIVAGLTTFFTMAYIIMVNPAILSLTGMPYGAVFIATILAAVIGTLIMAFVANVPYAQAPGMGLNAFFTFTVCFGMGFHWQEALSIVFICGIINIIITATKIRKSIIKAIPESLQNAIGGAVGLFIAYVGVKSAGLLTFTSDPGHYTALDSGTIVADSSIVPDLVQLNTPGVLLALIGLAIMIILLVLKIKGAIFIGIFVTAAIGVFMGVTDLSNLDLFNFGAVTEIKGTAFKMFSSPGIGTLFTSDRITTVLITIFAFSLADTFDTIGTFIGTGRVSGIFDEEDERSLTEGKGFASKMDRALFADATATSIGALLGTSNTTTYVESAAGIAAGGRTGLTSVVVSIMFLLCIPLADLFSRVPAEATAPALIIVGVMMMASFINIKWDDFEEAVSAFMTVIIMTFSYNISYGIAAGFIVYCLVKICKGQFKEMHPILFVSSLLFIANFILVATL